MARNISNLVFAGGGVLGISYLGVLDFLFHNNLMKNVERTAGTSAGAIAACITSFHLPFEEILTIADSLEYSKIPMKEDTTTPIFIPEDNTYILEAIFGDINCLYRLVTRYGWYSSQYFYNWLQSIIAKQFNQKKQPPYTFLDFKNPSLHKDGRSFHDLYVIGTNLTTGASQIFCYETTPMLEVAKAVRISMSIPLFFEAIEVDQPDITGNTLTNVFCDGGVMNNYPIKLFDSPRYNPKLSRGVNMDTLGIRFTSANQPKQTNNLIDYIWNLALSSGRIQEDEYYNNPMDRIRSIPINSMDISPVDFNVTPNDALYQLLYQQGFMAAKKYFSM